MSVIIAKNMLRARSLLDKPQTTVGGIKIANFATHEFKGKGSRAHLDNILAGYVLKPGRLALTPKCTLYVDLTVACLVEDHFMLFFRRYAGGASPLVKTNLVEDVSYANVSDDWHGIALSGPKSRMLLSLITCHDVGPEAFKIRNSC